MSNQEHDAIISEKAKKYDELMKTLSDIEGELRVSILRITATFFTLQEILKKDGKL